MEECQSQRRGLWIGVLTATQQLMRLWRSLVVWHQRRYQRKQQLYHLREMDDRMLKDIGLGPSDVERIAGTRRPWDAQVQRQEDLDWRHRSR